MYVDAPGMAGLAPLSNKSAELYISGSTVNTSDFRDLLSKIMTGKEGFSVPVNLQLNKKSVTDLVALYNASSQTRSAVYTTTKRDRIYDEMSNDGKFRLSYGISGGMTGVKFAATNNEPNSNVVMPVMSSYAFNPGAGVFVEKQLSTRVIDRIDFHAELFLTKSNIYLYNEYEKSYLQYTVRSDIFIDYLSIKVPVFLKINLTKGKLVPSLYAGAFITQYVASDFTYNYETEDKYKVVRQYSENSLSVAKNEYGWLAGAGINYKLNPKNSIYLQGRFEKGSGIYSSQISFSQSSTSISIVAGYKF